MKATTGDSDALGRIVERHRADWYQIAYRELASYEDARDAVAESVVRVCRFIHRLGSPEQFVPWARAIVRNESRRIRNRRRHNDVLDTDAFQTRPRVERVDELRVSVRSAITSLSPDQARAVQLYYLEGASVKEIATSLNRPEGTIKWILARGRASLAELLQEYKPMTIPENNRAVLVAPNLDPAYQTQLADMLKQAGWNPVRTVPDPAEFVRFLIQRQDAAPAPLDLFQPGDLVMLSERIGNVTVWELMPFLLSVRQRVPLKVLLLVESGREEKEMNATAMSGYLSGIDFLLVRPESLAELSDFVMHVRARLESEGGGI